MAELTYKERLQPSLLDRLTDDAPDRGKESRNERVLSPEKLRESVRRDLAWLFNTTNLAAVRPDIGDLDYISDSVLNYGLPDFTGKTASTVNIPVLEKELREAIWRFEPRLLRNTVKVTISKSDINYNVLSFTIEAVLWSQPMPLRLFLRTDVDLENGNVEIDEVRE